MFDLFALRSLEVHASIYAWRRGTWREKFCECKPVRVCVRENNTHGVVKCALKRVCACKWEATFQIDFLRKEDECESIITLRRLMLSGQLVLRRRRSRKWSLGPLFNLTSHFHLQARKESFKRNLAGSEKSERVCVQMFLQLCVCVRVCAWVWVCVCESVREEERSWRDIDGCRRRQRQRRHHFRRGLVVPPERHCCHQLHPPMKYVLLKVLRFCPMKS